VRGLLAGRGPNSKSVSFTVILYSDADLEPEGQVDIEVDIVGHLIGLLVIITYR
jgi:hypothetical protein